MSKYSQVTPKSLSSLKPWLQDKKEAACWTEKIYWWKEAAT